MCNQTVQKADRGKVKVVDVRVVAAFGHVALLRQQLQDAARRLLDQFDARRVVRELHFSSKIHCY